MVQRKLAWLAASTALAVLTPIARAQQMPASPPAETVAEEGDAGEDITVVGQRERGSVPGDIQPEQVLRPADIRAYGVGSINELLAELAPQLGGGRGAEGGRPVVLLNGRRISGFGEIRDIPPEAIERTEILPPEAGQQLGYRADQRVVNIVLRRRFNAITGEASGGGSTGGGRYTAAADANLLRIARDKRLTVNLHYDGATPLFDADRDIDPTPPSRPYSILGNITAAGGAREIDPALNALAGSAVTVAGVPSGVASRLPLAAFLTTPNSSDFGAFRTIAAATRKVSTNATYSQPIFGTITASLNMSFEATASDSELGLGSATFTVPTASAFSPFGTAVSLNRYLIEAGPRERQVDGDTGHVGLSLNGDIADWRWSFTSNYDRNSSRTLTDANLDLGGISDRIAAGDPAINPFNLLDRASLGAFRQDYARSVSSVANFETVVNGPLLTLPAGRVNASIKTGFETTDFDARAIRAGITTDSGMGRQAGSGQVRLDIPVASRRTGFLSAIGNLSLNGAYATDRLSDYGSLDTYSYGLNWSPIPQLFLLATRSVEDGAPTNAQLNNPVITTPDSRIFDFVTGDSVDITRIDGGNPNLRANAKRITSLTLNATPITNLPLNLTVEYTGTRIVDPIGSLPAPTAAIEAAFPDRFLRDAAGQLLRFDNRPVNFARSDQKQLRSGVNLSMPIGRQPQFGAGGPGDGRRRFERDANAAPSPGAPPATGTQALPAPRTTTRITPVGGPAGEQGGGGFRGGRGGFGGGGFGGGRLQLSVYHIWRLEDSIQLRSGVPELDLLGGDAIDTRGGRPRHQIEFNAGVTKGGYGVRLSGDWRQGTFVRVGTTRAPTDLDFSSLTTVTLRAFADFNPTMTLVREHRWLRGTRVSLTVRNLFDTRLKVTDALGDTPLNYQPDLLDPTGRTLTIGVRKLFF